VLSGEAINTNFIVVGLTRVGLYHTQGEHANQYTTDVVKKIYRTGHTPYIDKDIARILFMYLTLMIISYWNTLKDQFFTLDNSKFDYIIITMFVTYFRYYHRLVEDFENQMLSYRQQIETLEEHLASTHQPNKLTPDGIFNFFQIYAA
jgi:hypothetical protein